MHSWRLNHSGRRLMAAVRVATRLNAVAAIAALTVLFGSVSAAAADCEAYFPFDGSLADTAGGNAGRMFDKEGSVAAPTFIDGYRGQALQFTGAEVMRAFLDLHPKLCPQITISAWLKVDPSIGSTRVIISTGNPQSPGLRISRGALTANGPGNGLHERDVFRPQGGWTFVAAVYDFVAGTYTLHWRGRETTIDLVEAGSREPEEALWVGAMTDSLANPAGGVAIDELRIVPRALNREQLAEIRQAAGATPMKAATADQWGGTACTAHVDCGTGSYCGLDGRCHPDTHAPDPNAGTSATASGATLDQMRARNQLDPATQAAIAERVAETRPPDLTSAGGTADDSSTPLLDDPRVDPELQDVELSPLDSTPGQELQEDLDALPDRPPIVRETYNLEDYRQNASGPVKTMELVLPGSSIPETVTYMEVDGLAVAEGDIILGTLSELADWQTALEDEISVADGPGVRRQGLVAKSNRKYLWPGGRIPYTFHDDLPQASRDLATAAAKLLTDETNLFVEERESQDENWVEFKPKDNDDDACSSRVGMKQSKGSQTIKVDSDCGTITLVHEILHAAGLWHEQSRPDRDQFVEIFRENVKSGKKHNFNKKSAGSTITLGEYNYSSVMHYGEFTFGKDCIALGNPDPAEEVDCVVSSDGNSAARTLRALQPGAVIKRDITLASDQEAINTLYPNKVSPAQGRNWADGYYATTTAIGDVDGDGRGEVIIGRHAETNSRFAVYDDAAGSHQVMMSGPSNWGADVHVTDIAVGDVDGDGVDEIGVTRRSGANNRFYVYRVRNGALQQIFQGGDDWDGTAYATAIAFGDVDGDGRDEVAVGRRASQYGRYYLFDDAQAAEPFKRLAIGGSDWPSDAYTTALAFGDVDGDGRDELGVTRQAPSGFRYEVVEGNADFTRLEAGGETWDSTYYGTSIAFGNMDNDAGEEFAVGRRAETNSRFYLYDDASAQYARIDMGGDDWAPNHYTVGVAIADVDDDGFGELAVARKAGGYSRFYIFDDIAQNFRPLNVTGSLIPAGVGATDIALGHVDGNKRADVAITYETDVQGLIRFDILHMN